MADDPMDGDGDAGSQGGGFDWATPVDELDIEEGSRDLSAGRDSVLYVVDMSKAMYEKGAKGSKGNSGAPETAIKTTLLAIRKAISSFIFRSDLDYLGIVLYNTSKSVGTNFKNIYVLEELQRPGAEVIKKLDQLIQMDPEELRGEFGCVENCPIGDLLWACNSIFSSVTIKLATKRVLLFTANDNPHAGNQKSINFAKQKGLDISENGIAVIVFPLSRAASGFNMKLFWDMIVTMNEDGEDASAHVISTGDWEQLESAIRRKDHAKRAMARTCLTLGEGLALGVQVFNLVRTATKPPAVKLYKKTNEQVMTERTSMEEESATVLMPTDVKKYMKFAGRNLYFTPAEVDELKKFGPPGFSVIAFKPLKYLKKKFYIRPAQFIYPDESNIKGSTKLFIALLSKCLEKEVMAICRYIPRENISPKLVALVPQEEELNELLQVTPNGFHVIFLPFADDFRSALPLAREHSVADEEMIAKAKEIVKKLRFPYYVESFANPALATHYSNIELMALNVAIADDQDEEALKVEDATEPDVDRMERRAGKLIKEFVAVVYPRGYDPGASAPKKRPAGDRNTEPGDRKRGAAKAEAEDIPAAAENGSLKKFTVAVLKQYCQANGIHPEGSKKDDLIAAIETHLAGND